jgi:hypothetical protein
MGVFDEITKNKMVEINRPRFKVLTDKSDIAVIMEPSEYLNEKDEYNALLRLNNTGRVCVKEDGEQILVPHDSISKEEGRENEYQKETIVQLDIVKRLKKDGTPDRRFKNIIKEKENE